MSSILLEPEAPELEGAQEKPPALWDGWDGLSVMALGFFVPALLITVSSIVCFERIMRIAFKHPVETLIECAFVLLIPFANYFVWKAIRFEDGRHPLRLGLANGAAIATALSCAGLTFASLFFGFPPGYCLLGGVALMSALVSTYLAVRLRNCAGTRKSQANRIMFSTLGLILSFAGLAACEGRGVAVRVAETMALSDTASERERGLKLLRQFNCEQDLRMQCADNRTAGIPGVFWRISPEREREVYFAVIGRPYGNSLTESVYSMSDEYLNRHVVGPPIDGMTLHRSQIAGYINAESLTSTVNWTFVLKNNTYSQQEARAEIALPPGAVISDLTYWAEGSAHQAMVGPTDRIQIAGVANGAARYNWVDVGTVDPALLTDLGRGRALLKLSEVPGQSERKVQVTFTQRLKPLELTKASLTLPKFVNTNFALKGDHSLRLHSADWLSVPVEMKTVKKQPAADGGYLLLGTLSANDLNGSNVNVIVSRDATMGPFYIEDKQSSNGGYIKETIRRVGTSAPTNLVVVVDNSQSMKRHAGALIEALSQMPDNIKASVVMPTDGGQMEPVDLAKGIELIKSARFEGGKDNLEAVVKAAETAGETHHGAVLWVHGPQPSFNQEMYIMAPYIQRPAFYELSLDDRFTDTSQFFKNHSEIGPFNAVARASTEFDDLRSFLAKWKTGGSEFKVELVRTNEKPNCKQADARSGEEMIRLCAHNESYQLMSEDKLVEAAELAMSTRIVTPVTGAVVLHRHIAPTPQNEARLAGSQLNGAASVSPQVAYETAAPPLQGATNGTIGPVYGVNTAGTVRVNNLANLEALLNILANLGELFGVGIGLILLVTAAIGVKLEKPVLLSRQQRAIIGGALVTAGIMLPGFLNWMVASARDANLFS